MFEKRIRFLALLLAVAASFLVSPSNGQSPSSLVLPLPVTYKTATYVSALSFDYATATPTSATWTAGYAAVTGTNGTDLVTTTSTPNQGTYNSVSTIPSGTTNFRIEVTAESSFTAAGTNPCALFGMLLIDSTSPPTYMFDNTANNYKALGHWQQICANGTGNGAYTSPAIAGFKAPGTTSVTLCSKCQVPTAATLGKFQYIIQIVNNEITIALLPSSYPSPMICFSRADVSLASAFLSGGTAALSLVGLNYGVTASVRVTKVLFFKLTATSAAVASSSNPNYDLWGMPASVQQIFYQDSLSFDSTTVSTSSFQYSKLSQVSTSSSAVVFNTTTASTTGSIISQKTIPTTATNFRIEATFTVTSISSGASPSSIGLMIVDPSAAPVDTAAILVNDTMPKAKGLYISMVLTTAGYIVTLNQASLATNLKASTAFLPGCTGCSGMLPISKMASGVQLVVQVFNDLLTVSVYMTGDPQPITCVSNSPVSGVSSSISANGAYIQVTHYSASELATVTMSRLGFFELSTSTPTLPMLQTTALPFSSETGFPIPTLMHGHADPLVSIDEVLTCKYVQPKVRAPDSSKATDVYFTLTIDRLLDIDDLEETVSISASVYLQWGVSTCLANTTASTVNDLERVIVTQSSVVWHPTILFANSSNDVYMQSSQFGDDMQVLYVPDQPYRTLYFYWTRIGTFSAKCPLDLRQFPFDRQTCDFTFLMKEPTEFVKFGGIYLKPPDMSPNGQWILDESLKSTGTVPSTIVRNGMASYAKFRLKFIRNPSYHIYNLLTPCFVLIALVFGSFLMPPEKPDRPVICCTILLAFIVAQSDVLKEVPHTSQRILLAEYILFFTGLTATVTIFDMGMCWLAKFNSKFGGKISIFSKKSMTMNAARAFDLAAFLLAIDFFGIINIYAMTVIDSS